MPVNPPDQNITIIKINETQFYRAATSSEMIDIPFVMDTIAKHQAQIDYLCELLQLAHDQNVSGATDAITVLVDQPLSSKLKGKTSLVDSLPAINP